MTADTDPLDVIESRVSELEQKTYGENLQPTDPILDSLLQANTIITAVLSGKEKVASLYKRLKELNDYLEMNHVTDDPMEAVTKLNVILSMENEFRNSIELLENVHLLRDILNDDKIKNAEILREDLNELISNHLSQREQLQGINAEVGQVLNNFNEISLEISKSFFLLNEAITNVENSLSR